VRPEGRGGGAVPGRVRPVGGSPVLLPGPVRVVLSTPVLIPQRPPGRERIAIIQRSPVEAGLLRGSLGVRAGASTRSKNLPNQLALDL